MNTYYVINDVTNKITRHESMNSAVEAAKKSCEETYADAVECLICTLSEEWDEFCIERKFRREWHEDEAWEVDNTCSFGAIYDASKRLADLELAHYKEAAAKIAAMLEDNDQLISCTYYATKAEETEADADEENVELTFWNTHGAKEEDMLYDALRIAEEVMGEPYNVDGNGDGTRIYGWSREIKA